MDDRLKYCFGLAAVYGEVLFLVAVSTNIPLFEDLFELPFWLSTTVPHTIAQICAVPLYLLGILVLWGILPLEKKVLVGATS
jgi:hypothetical protein